MPFVFFHHLEVCVASVVRSYGDHSGLIASTVAINHALRYSEDGARWFSSG